jgi:Eukaryotic protein of unknown function (DUF842)
MYRCIDASIIHRFLQAMEKMVGVLDKSHLRPMQKDSYLCMSKCCDTAGTPADLQQWYVCMTLLRFRSLPTLFLLILSCYRLDQCCWLRVATSFPMPSFNMHLICKNSSSNAAAMVVNRRFV